jgi:hypothetical protein
MKVIEVTIQEIWQQTKPKVFKNKKKYNRKKEKANLKLERLS